MPNLTAGMMVKPIAFQTDVLHIIAMHGNLLLGLRHPSNTGESREVLRNVIEEMEAALISAGCLSFDEVSNLHRSEIEECAKMGRAIEFVERKDREQKSMWDLPMRRIIEKWWNALGFTQTWDATAPVEEVLDRHVFPEVAKRLPNS